MAAPCKDSWGSRLGVILAVAGNAAGLGNFIRFPGQGTFGLGFNVLPMVFSAMPAGSFFGAIFFST